MFKVGDMVKVLNKGNTYDMFSTYFNRNNIEYLEINFTKFELPNETSTYIVQFVLEANNSCVIQDTLTKQVFIVGNNSETLKEV